MDSRVQAAAYRGVTIDSVPASDTITGPSGGPTTRDGYAVSCFPGSAYCTFFRPGPEVDGAPATLAADLSVWGLGVPGLAFHAKARAGTTLGDPWPGTEPALQLLEGYAQYAMQRFTVQLGRQTVASRLGFTGFDGGAVTFRGANQRLEVRAYGGWGLWRGSVLPVTSPALNPLNEFRPPERTLVAGGGAGWTSPRFDLTVLYQREVDPSVDYFASELAAVTAVVRVVPGVQVSGGADYNLAEGLWGSAEGTLAYAARNGRINASATVRRYRPRFDLWTIWGAFSPVPYTAVDGSFAVTPVRPLLLRATGEYYTFANTETSTPLVNVESQGWRFSWDATYTPTPLIMVQGGYRADFGPGASSRGFDGSATYMVGERLAVGVQGSTLDRPLELRFDESSVVTYGVSARYRPAPRLRIELDANQYVEDRKRPDAAAFDWDQLRVSARVVFSLASHDELRGLPPAVRQMPAAPRSAP
ncbi:MAG TPA: hypothetical protein VLV16_01240 [Gemmatimonadales bacterium]|nr:hypothetical protein [Gemmatimonadales bacterium]